MNELNAFFIILVFIILMALLLLIVGRFINVPDDL